MGYCRPRAVSVYMSINRALLKTYLKGTNVALLIYDITEKNDFE
jgi:hypothetical protein